MQVQVFNPFREGNHFWLGLEEEGLRRKVFKVVDAELAGSEFFVGGLTIFEPGEASSVHNHPDSEEVNFVVKGTGKVVSEGEERPFGEHEFMFIPRGVFHQHVNTGTEPVWLLFLYGPPGQIPTR